MMQCTRRGFTFIELTMVMMILAILAVMALPSMGTVLASARLSAGLSEITTALQYAQYTALSTGRPCRVTIDSVAELILVEQIQYGADFMNPAETALAEIDVEDENYATMASPLKPGALYSVSFAAEDRFEGVDITSAVFGTGNNVVFDAIGKPSSSGAILLTLGGIEATLSMSSVSGSITHSDW